MAAVDPARLESIPLFELLSPSERAQVALYADEVDAPAGRTLAEEGEFAYEFFVILEGTAEVEKDGEVIAELGPNDFFGEIGLLEAERRTATVVAKTPMQLLLMFGPHFRRFERELPELAGKVRAAIRDRLSP
jgi:CRP/FNR family transcriptional regulator, cyclic AMP receptor protein